MPVSDNTVPRGETANAAIDYPDTLRADEPFNATQHPRGAGGRFGGGGVPTPAQAARSHVEAQPAARSTIPEVKAPAPERAGNLSLGVEAHAASGGVREGMLNLTIGAPVDEDNDDRADDFDESKHPRDEHGRFGAGSADELAARSKAQGGDTFDPRSGDHPAKGYSVSVYKGREQVLPGKDAITGDHIRDFVEKNKDLLSDPGTKSHVGTWYNPDDDKWYLDVSRVEPKLSDAATLGRDNAQLGIYDLKRGETIHAPEYQEAIAGTGRFAGRTDASRPGAGPRVLAGDEPRRDGGGDERPPREAQEGVRTAKLDGILGRKRRLDDFDESKHPRDERGRFGAGGGSAPAQGWRGSAGSAKNTLEAYKKDGKWSADREALHQAYARQVTAGVPKSDSPTVYMTGGGPASGKTTAILSNPDANFPDDKHASHIDPDGAKAALPEFRAGTAAHEPGAAAFVHEESSEMSKQAISQALRDGHDVVFDSTGDSGADKMASKVAGLRAAGAKRVVANYVYVDPDEALKRSDARAAQTGRFVPHDVVNATHTLVSRTGVQSIRGGLFDQAQVWDNNGAKPRLIAKYDRAGGLQVLDQGAWDAWEKVGQRPLPPGWGDQ